MQHLLTWGHAQTQGHRSVARTFSIADQGDLEFMLLAVVRCCLSVHTQGGGLRNPVVVQCSYIARCWRFRFPMAFERVNAETTGRRAGRDANPKAQRTAEIPNRMRTAENEKRGMCTPAVGA